MNERLGYPAYPLRDEDGHELALPRFACPACGEPRLDWLVWQGPDFEIVKCATCGHEYTPA